LKEEFLTVRQLADKLGLGERAIRDRLSRGEIKGKKLGDRGKWFIPQHEVDRLLGQGEAEALPELVAKLKQQLYTPQPDVVLIRDFGGLGTHSAHLEYKSLDVMLHDLNYSAGMRATITTINRVPSEGQKGEICWRVLADGTVEMYYPLGADPSFESRFSSIDTGVNDKLVACKREGGHYLAQCSQLLNEIHDQARSRLGVQPVFDLIQKLPKVLPSPPQPLTPHFGDLVYQLAIHYYRSSGSYGLPDSKLYLTHQRDLLFSDLVLGEARIHLATALHSLASSWANVHRQMIIEWGQSQAIAALLQLFGKVQGIENTIKAGLGWAMYRR
jgi:hypothetical protein